MIKASRKRPAHFTALLALGFLVFAQILAPPTANSAFAQAQQNTQGRQTKAAELPPLPESPMEKAQKGGIAMPLSLKDLTKLALRNNLDIAISDTNELIQNQRLIGAYGAYDPTLTSALATSSTKSANTNQTNTSNTTFNKSDVSTWRLDFQQFVKTGGTAVARLTGSRTDNNQIFSLFTPQYNSGIFFQFTQPLIQNFRIDSTRTNIKLINLDIKINDSQFQQQVNEIISSVQSQYWDLVAAMENYRITRESVNLARITLQNNRKKVEIGTLAPLDITMAESQLASREVELIQAEESINTVENAVRNLVSNDRNAEIWSKIIVPTDSPDFKEQIIELNQALDTALKNRPELAQQDFQVMQTDISRNYSQNLKKWKFDVVGSFGTSGVSGPQSISTITGLPTIPTDLVGGFGNSYKTLFTGGFTNWQVGFNITVPLRNRTVDSQVAQYKIQKQQQLMTRKKTEQQILVEVRNAVQSLETKKKSVETSGVATRLAKEQLDGEEKRFQAGLSNNFLVLDAQNKLSSAQYQQLYSLISYKKAVIQAQKSMYVLLESNDFEIAKESSNSVPDLK